MTRRFSPQELTFLRNRVPISCVIETLLDFPTRSTNGKLSFACPVCGAFDTSINAAHNLVRCYACRKIVNPIELVMHQLKIDFVDSVKWLKKRISAAQAQNTTPEKKAQPATIGDIMADMMSALPDGETNTPCSVSITQRISQLQHSVRHLYRVIDELRSSLDQ